MNLASITETLQSTLSRFRGGDTPHSPAAAEIERGTFEHAGYTLSYELHGPENGTPALLLHGILLDAAVNRNLAEALAGEGFRVVLLDLLGHGRSDKPNDATELRVDFFSEQARAALDHLGIVQAVIGGVSLGAITALQLASQSPERVRALLLEMPVMEKSTPFAALLLVPIMMAVDFAAPVQRRLARLLRKLPTPRKAVWESVLNAASQEPETIRAVLHGILVGPVVPPRRLREKIQAPALVIGHKGDWLHNLEDARRLASELPNARLLTARSILELRTRPERLMPEILSFLRDTAGIAAVPPAPTTAAEPKTSEVSNDMPLEQQFEAAVEKVRTAPASGPLKPSNEFKLKMYALFRQARDGDVQGKRPGLTDIVGRYKYDAWATLQGTSREEAMRRYIAEVQALERKVH
jgi:pimeloyl-ACP methyl ester carboxylesterase/acyl-CoA-binding protein